MLFDRFVFILYILFNYNWLLLGIIYDSKAQIIPIIAIICSLVSVIIVTLFQLQTVIQRSKLNEDDQWSTITWSVVHIFLSILFLFDILELMNTLAMFLIAGVFITFVTSTVFVMSCRIIANSSDVWIPHVHLTCVCFWVLVNYLYVSLPTTIPYLTVIPVILMLILRLYENSNSFQSIFMEGILFAIAIALHICFETNMISVEHFYQLTAITLVLMILVTRQFKSVLVIFSLPFILISFGLYFIVCLILWHQPPTVRYLTVKYNDFVRIEELVLTLDGSDNEEDWNERL